MTLAQTLDKKVMKKGQPPKYVPTAVLPPTSIPNQDPTAAELAKIKAFAQQQQPNGSTVAKLSPGAPAKAANAGKRDVSGTSPNLTTPAAPGPVNPAPRGGTDGTDSCAAASLLSGASGTRAASNVGSTNTAGDLPAGACFAANADTWFQWVAPSTGSATFSFCAAQGGSSGFDTVLAAHVGCGGPQLVCNDDFCGLQSSITFAVVQGCNYRIRFSGFGGQTGTGTLGWTSTTGAPANDACAAAINISAGTYCYSTVGATPDAPAGCFATPDVWYNVVTAVNGNCTFSTCNQTSHDSVLSAYAVCGGAALACLDDSCGLQTSITVPSTAGVPTKFRIAGFSGTGSGGFTLSFVPSGGGGPANNNCANATPIGDGTTPYNPTGATTDGPSNCITQMNDVWFSYTASCTGTATATTCFGGAAPNDTVVSVYDACGGTLLDCDDDGGGCPAPNGFSGSTASFPVVAGNTYRIQVGQWTGDTFPIAPGNITLSCQLSGPLVCTAYNPPIDCQTPSFADGYNCTNFLLAEGITSNVPVNSVCINAIYFNNVIVPDAWVITFLEDLNGRPDVSQVIDTFTQGVDMVVTGPADTGMDTFGRNVYEFNMVLSRPVAAPTNRCVWMQMQDFASGDSVFVQTASGNGDGQTAQDLDANGSYGATDVQPNDVAVCINGGFRNNASCFQDPCAGNQPANDNCGSAQPIGDGIFAFTNVCASTDGGSPCGALAADVWFLYTAPASGAVTATTCNGGAAGFDTALAVYDGGVCTGALLGCNDDGPPTCPAPGGFSGSTVAFTAVAGQQYLIQVGGFGGGQGSGDLTVGGAQPCVNNVPGDCCNTAIAIGDGTTPFDAAGANTDGPSNCAPQGEDVWFAYTATCTGSATVTTCLGGAAAYDSVVSVYANCGGAVIGCDDDGGGCPAPGGFSGSSVTFNATAGTTYIVQVGSYGGIGATAGTQITASCAVVVPCNEPCTLAAADCQPRTDNNGYNTTQFRAAENYTRNGPINHICFSGVYIDNSAPAAQTFTINFYDDAGGVPGTVQATYTTGVGCAFDTGELLLGTYTSFEHNVSISPAYSGPANGWIEIITTLETFFWQTGSGGDGTFVQDIDGNPGYQAPGDVIAGDLALCINQGPGVPCCDYNNDNIINSQDFFDFIACFFTVACNSDFNLDGIENSQDFFDFIVCFFTPPAGCP